MGGLLIDILVFLGLLFLALMILAPIFYFFDKDKADEAGEKDQEEAADKDAQE